MSGSRDPYCYPGTGVLRNTAGLRDARALEQLERDVVAQTGAQVAAGTVPGVYDLEHLREFHRRLFSPIYPWAGELRTINIGKEKWFGPHEHIASYGAEVLGKLAAENHLKGLEAPAFVKRAAFYLSEIDAIHPFREGNGRTERAFVSQLAREAGFHLAWDRVSREQNVRAFVDAFDGDRFALRSLLTQITQPIDPGQDAAQEAIKRMRAATFPVRGGGPADPGAGPLQARRVSSLRRRGREDQGR